MGDIRYVDGQKQMWLLGDGWGDCGDGGEATYLEMPDCGGPDGLGAQVGQMG